MNTLKKTLATLVLASTIGLSGCSETFGAGEYFCKVEKRGMGKICISAESGNKFAERCSFGENSITYEERAKNMGPEEGHEALDDCQTLYIQLEGYKEGN